MNLSFNNPSVQVLACCVISITSNAFAAPSFSMPSFANSERRFEDFLGREADNFSDMPELSKKEREEYSNFIIPFLLNSNQIDFSKAFSEKNLWKSGFKLFLVAQAIKASGDKDAAVLFIEILSKSVDQDILLNAKKIYVMQSLLSAKSLRDEKGLPDKIIKSAYLFLGKIGIHGTKSMSLHKLRGGEANLYSTLESSSVSDGFQDVFSDP